MSKRLIVIGGDGAGMSAASTAKRRMPDLEVVAFEMGGFVSYAACGIPFYTAGLVKRIEDLVAVDVDEFRTKRGIDARVYHRVEKISPDRKTVTVNDLKGGRVREEPYDYLVVATGASPVVPPGLDPSMPGVFSLRGLEDARALRAYIGDRGARSALIVGGSYIGLEMAEGLRAAGVEEIHVIEMMPRLIPAMEEEISKLVADEVRARNVNAVLGAGARAIERKGERLSVSLTDGQTLETDLVLLAVGVAPNSQLARDAGIELGFKNAVKVDRRQKTSKPDIYAVGDCAEVYHLILDRNVFIPLALNANRAGRVAGENIAGGEVEFPGMIGSSSSKIFELVVARAGLGLEEAHNAGFEAVKVVVDAQVPAPYLKSTMLRTLVIAEKKTGRLLGAQLAGDMSVGHRINAWAVAATQGMSLDRIYDLDLAYSPPFNAVWNPMLVAAQVAAKKIK